MAFTEYVVGLLSDSSEPADPNPRGPHTGSTAHDAESDTTVGDLSVVYECRRCGTTVTASVVHCPRCEKPAIAEYVVE